MPDYKALYLAALAGGDEALAHLEAATDQLAAALHSLRRAAGHIRHAQSVAQDAAIEGDPNPARE